MDGPILSRKTNPIITGISPRRRTILSSILWSRSINPRTTPAFGFSLPGGDYVLKAFFNGHMVGKPFPFTAKDRGTVELKEPLKLDEGDSK